MKENLVGGVLDHIYDPIAQVDVLEFVDCFTNKKVRIRQRCAALVNQVDIYQEGKAAYNAGFYLGKYMKNCWAEGDKLRLATDILVSL